MIAVDKLASNDDAQKNLYHLKKDLKALLIRFGIMKNELTSGINDKGVKINVKVSVI